MMKTPFVQLKYIKLPLYILKSKYYRYVEELKDN